MRHLFPPNFDTYSKYNSPESTNFVPDLSTTVILSVNFLNVSLAMCVTGTLIKLSPSHSYIPTTGESNFFSQWILPGELLQPFQRHYLRDYERGGLEEEMSGENGTRKCEGG